MRITMNEKNLIPDETYQIFRKVRAVIENEEGQIAISSEGGKYIFPGGKCDQGEDELIAIQREVREETGIECSLFDFEKVLELEAIYDDTIDYRTEKVRPRYTLTTFYYVRTNKGINRNKMNLTEGEIEENFDIAFVDKDRLFEMLSEDHSHTRNGKMFDEENQIVLNEIIRPRMRVR